MKGDPLGNVQEIWIWPYKQVIYAQPRICPRERDAPSFLGFWDTNRSPNLGKTTRSSDIQQKKKKRKGTCWIVDFAIPVDNRVKIKESEKRVKYLDLAKELKKTVEHEGDSDTNCNWCTWNNPQRLGKWTGRLGNKRTSGDHPE